MTRHKHFSVLLFWLFCVLLPAVTGKVSVLGGVGDI